MELKSNKKYEIITKEKQLKNLEGRKTTLMLKDGTSRTGTVRIKAVRCGKQGCTKCPHKVYAYLRYREGSHVREKYLGIAR